MVKLIDANRVDHGLRSIGRVDLHYLSEVVGWI